MQSINYCSTMGVSKNIAGKVFGRLTAVKPVRLTPQGTVWECACRCGSSVEARIGHLQGKKIRSCGCLRSDLNQKLFAKHGMSSTPTYEVWKKMKYRVKNHPAYQKRGMCSEWENFENFLDDMGPKPDGPYSIERVDNDGPYAPWNCIWADTHTQSRNRGNNVFIVYKGAKMVVTDAARLSGIPDATLRARIKNGWDASDLFIPLQKRRPPAHKARSKK